MSETSSKSPNYFHPSETLSDLFCPVILRGGDNYAEWSTNIRNLLQAKQKTGYIDGSIPKPLTNPDRTMWLRANSMIVLWILTTIDPILHSTVSCMDSNELWVKLRRRFSFEQAIRVYQLKSEICACKQEDGQSVQDYFDRLFKMWDELESYKATHECCCSVERDIEKEKEDDKVHQFLMGLDDSRFNSIRFNIIGKCPLPHLNHVYSLVVKEEQHLQAAQSKELKPKPEPYVPPRGRGKNISCSHCCRKGHEVEECFALHGYPERQRNKSTNTRGARGRQGSSLGKSTDTQGKVHASQITITNQSQKSPSLNLDSFNAFLNLRKMQDPYSNIYSGGPSSTTNLYQPSDSNRFPMAQKLEAKGGNGGMQWDDGANYEGISQIYIREGREGIESIKIDYVNNEKPIAGPIHGGFGRDCSFTESFDLVYVYDHEFIISVKCYYEEGVIQGLRIKTNIRSSALMGSRLGTKFKMEVKGKKIIGFHGSAEKNLNSLGAYFTTLSPTNLNNLER